MATLALSVLAGQGGAGTRVPVPDLSGLTVAEAASALAAAGLRPGRVREVPSLAVPAGLVVGQHPAAGDLVKHRRRVHLELAAPAAHDPDVVPDSWVGEWLFTVSYQSLASGNVGAVEESEAAICPGDAVGLVVIADAAGGDGDSDSDRDSDSGTDSDSDSDSDTASGPRISPDSHCSVAIADGPFDVHCQVRLVFDSQCTVDALVSLGGARSGDSLSATGEWSTVAVGTCAPLPPAGGEAVEVQGQRVSADPGACADPRPSLTQQLVRHPNLILLGLGETDDDSDSDD